MSDVYQVPFVPDPPSARHRWCVVLGVATMGGCMALRVLWLFATVLNPEFDGMRKLQSGYELWMLNGYPRFISDNSSFAHVTVPEDVNPETANWEVGRYAEVGTLIVGVLDPYVGWNPRSVNRPPPAPKWFIIRGGSVAEYATEGQCPAAIRGLGVETTLLQLRR